jgi:hypothetical protein
MRSYKSVYAQTYLLHKTYRDLLGLYEAVYRLTCGLMKRVKEPTLDVDYFMRHFVIFPLLMLHYCFIPQLVNLSQILILKEKGTPCLIKNCHCTTLEIKAYVLVNISHRKAVITSCLLAERES